MTRTSAAAMDLVVGAAARLVAALAMNLFQSVWTRLAGSEEPDETAASRAADAVSEEVSGEPVKRSAKKSADRVAHYPTGAGLGGLYGLGGGFMPVLMRGGGALFGGRSGSLGMRSPSR